MHPFTPFISEEIWHLIGDKKDEDCIMVAPWPTLEVIDEELLLNFILAEEVITNIRNIRKEKNIANKVTLDLLVIANEKTDSSFNPIISKISNLSSLEYIESKVDNAFSFVLKSNEYFVPFSEDIDVEAEIKKIEEELKYTKGFLISVSKKLSNERFVSNAPEQVVAVEKKKMADAEAKVKILEEKLNTFA
tara:strand:- start:355 stop:927 length:573 start_codon:yes stop_codon:yes gene_type:complete